MSFESMSCANRQGSLHFNFHSHPGVKAALKVVRAFGQSCKQRCAALNDPGLGYGEVVESTRAFRYWLFPAVQASDKAATKLLHFRERVRLAPLVNDRNDSTFVDGELVGLKVPFGIRSSGRGFSEQVLNRGGKSQRGERDILAEVRADRLVEGGRIAFVQGDDLGDGGWAIRLNCSCEDQATGDQTESNQCFFSWRISLSSAFCRATCGGTRGILVHTCRSHFCAQ